MVHPHQTLPVPFELPILIYGHLFSADDPITRSVRYRHTDGIAHGLSTAILRVSKQTSVEASRILYRNKTFRLDLLYHDEIINGRDIYQTRRSVVREDCALSYHRSPINLELPVISFNGLIYNWCFRRLSKIELLISYDSFWWRGAIAAVGKTFIHALRLLASDESQQYNGTKPKSLSVTMESDLNGKLVIERDAEMRISTRSEAGAQAADIVDLLKLIQNFRQVKLVQTKIEMGGFGAEHLREGEVGEVDLNVFQLSST